MSKVSRVVRDITTFILDLATSNLRLPSRLVKNTLGTSDGIPEGRGKETGSASYSSPHVLIAYRSIRAGTSSSEEPYALSRTESTLKSTELTISLTHSP